VVQDVIYYLRLSRGSSRGSKARSTKFSDVSPLRSSAPIWLCCKPTSTRSEFRYNRRKRRTSSSAGSAGRGAPDQQIGGNGDDRIFTVVRFQTLRSPQGFGENITPWSPSRGTSEIGIAAEFAPSFALDNGAFSLWRAGQRRPAWDPYYRWVEVWRNHPGFDFAIIPDVIDGSEEENDDLLAEWPFFDGVPVYHLHESLDRLVRLTNSYSRIALGSSGPYRSTCTLRWWGRIQQIMTLVCGDSDLPTVKLHGLRILAPGSSSTSHYRRRIRHWWRGR
jgi:hypothetical protein